MIYESKDTLKKYSTLCAKILIMMSLLSKQQGIHLQKLPFYCGGSL